MRIALLLPRSMLYPSLSFDMMDGLRSGLKKTGMDTRCEVVSASIGLAAKNEEIYARCEQVLLDGADVVVAYMNPLSAEYVHALFQSAGKRLVVLDSGYHFPAFQGKLSHAWFLSLQGNLCCRAIMQKAAADGYRNFALSCSFYDAGYRPSYSYTTAAEDKGGTVGLSHITPLRRAEFSLDRLAEYLGDNKDAAMLASFCGDMAEDFFRESSRLELSTTYDTYGAAFTAEEEWLAKIPYPGKDWDAAVPWARSIATPANEEFVSTLEGIRENKANIFSLLGWEAALFIAATETGSPEGIVLDSPRGRVQINPETQFSEAPVYFARVTKNEGTGNCRLTDVRDAGDLQEERRLLQRDIDYIQTTTANSWLNAYACLDS
ncbi:MAG: hypothetical protein IBJ09_09415 [Bacteroidia bacterium]|nr:hypothetical protein [Bacteroidia bacterium]